MEFAGPIAKLPLSDEVFKNLKQATLGQNHAESLAGVLEDQYLVNDKECPEFVDFIKAQSLEYLQIRHNDLIFHHIVNSFRNDKWNNKRDEFDVKKHFDLNIDRIWLNSGTNNSYSPLHIHSGLFSFMFKQLVPWAS